MATEKTAVVEMNKHFKVQSTIFGAMPEKYFLLGKKTPSLEYQTLLS